MKPEIIGMDTHDNSRREFRVRGPATSQAALDAMLPLVRRGNLHPWNSYMRAGTPILGKMNAPGVYTVIVNYGFASEAR